MAPLVVVATNPASFSVSAWAANGRAMAVISHSVVSARRRYWNMADLIVGGRLGRWVGAPPRPRGPFLNPPRALFLGRRGGGFVSVSESRSLVSPGAVRVARA